MLQTFLYYVFAWLPEVVCREAPASPVPRVDRAQVTWVPGYNGYAVVPLPAYTPESIRAAQLAGEDMQDLTNGLYSDLGIEPVDWWL